MIKKDKLKRRGLDKMVSTFWVVFSFFAGAIIGRYFEKIIKGIRYMQEDLAKAQEQMNRSLSEFEK